MRAALMFRYNVRGKVTRQCPQITIFEKEGEPKRNRTEVPVLTSLTPYRWAKPALLVSSDCLFTLYVCAPLRLVRNENKEQQTDQKISDNITPSTWMRNYIVPVWTVVAVFQLIASSDSFLRVC